MTDVVSPALECDQCSANFPCTSIRLNNSGTAVPPTPAATIFVRSRGEGNELLVSLHQSCCDNCFFCVPKVSELLYRLTSLSACGRSDNDLLHDDRYPAFANSIPVGTRFQETQAVCYVSSLRRDGVASIFGTPTVLIICRTPATKHGVYDQYCSLKHACLYRASFRRMAVLYVRYCCSPMTRTCGLCPRRLASRTSSSSGPANSRPPLGSASVDY